MIKYGICFCQNGGHPDSHSIIGWFKNSDGQDRTWDDYSKALEALDIEYGWTGYVRYYPSGNKVKRKL